MDSVAVGKSAVPGAAHAVLLLCRCFACFCPEILLMRVLYTEPKYRGTLTLCMSRT